MVNRSVRRGLRALRGGPAALAAQHGEAPGARAGLLAEAARGGGLGDALADVEVHLARRADLARHRGAAREGTHAAVLDRDRGRIGRVAGAGLGYELNAPEAVTAVLRGAGNGAERGEAETEGESEAKRGLHSWFHPFR